MSWSGIVSLVSNALAVLRQLLNMGEAAKDRAAGRAEAERDQAREGATVQADIGKAAADSVTEDDAIAKMKRGEG